jgi:hypothetical protein
MADGDMLRVEVRGDREVLRALDGLPRDAVRELKDGQQRIARSLATTIRAAARANSRQSARASRTVRTARGVSPIVVAGPHPLLFGSEFGATARFGWYRRARYRNSPARQFRRHLNRGSYWFFRTQQAERPRVQVEANEIAAAVVRRWSA